MSWPTTPSTGSPRPELDPRPEETLDPDVWEAIRELGRRMVDDIVEYHRMLASQPAWRPVPVEAKAALDRPLPRAPEGAEQAYADFREHVLPYAYGNIHPRSWGWVNGTGTTLGAYAEMLAAAMNPNVWGGEHGAVYVEAQVLRWAKEIFGFPPEASGLLVSGGSVANLIGLAAARESRAGGDVAQRGLRALPEPLAVYVSEETHNSVDKAVALLGIGLEGLRRVPVDEEFRIDLAALESAIAEDRARGVRPICVVGTAGTVNTGAIDDLAGLADICRREGLWLHVDGAFGALAALSPALKPLLDGLERADSVACDFHKWLYMPIEVGCVLVRDREAHERTFSPPASYLAALERGLASGPHHFARLGPQLTRGFRALKVWLSLKAHGADAYGRLIEQNVRQARRLESLVEGDPRLELLAPVPLNVVCFRYRPASGEDVRGARAADAVNREILMRLQERGIAVPSSTVVRGAFALRCAFTNHRTRDADLDRLVEAVIDLGEEMERRA